MTTNRLLLMSYSILLIILLAACNPKPEIVEEVIEEGPAALIEQPEKLLEAEPTIHETNLTWAGLERLSYYFDIPWNSQDNNKIFVESELGYYSIIDYLEMIQEKGHIIVPKYGTPQDIMEEIDQGRPVLAEFPLSGSTPTEALFHGYNDESLFYYQLSSLKEKKIPVERMKGFDEKDIKLFVYSQQREELESSEYYFLLVTRDVLMKKDTSLATQTIQRIEEEDWIDKDEAFRRFSIIYYTFYDPQPDLVEPLLEEISYHPILHAEINFMLSVLREDKEKALESMMQMNLSEGQLFLYNEETIYQVGLLALETDKPELARTAFEYLENKTPDYPGLSDALEKLK